MSRCREIPLIRIEPTSAIAAAAQGGAVSASRVGKHVKSAGPPLATFEDPGTGFEYLFDLIPRNESARLIALHATPDKSAALTLTTSYLTTDPAEVNNNETDESLPNIGGSFERAHSLLVQFGAGDARHNFEIDVSEGSSCNVPGNTVEVTLLDYTFQRISTEDVDQIANNRLYTDLRSFASLAAGTNVFPARLTSKVYAPYQVAVDLQDPPSVDDYLNDLMTALSARTFLA